MGHAHPFGTDGLLHALCHDEVRGEARQRQQTADDGQQRAAPTLEKGLLLNRFWDVPPDDSRHPRTSHRRLNRLRWDFARTTRNGQDLVKHVKGQIPVAANDRAKFLLQDRNFFGAVHPRDLELHFIRVHELTVLRRINTKRLGLLPLPFDRAD